MKSATQLPPSRAPLPPAGEPDAEDLGYEDLVPPQRGFSTPLITGTLFWRFRTADEAEAAPTRRGRPYPVEIFNSAMLLDSEGRIVDVYDKTLRMIFSEYVPGGYAFYRLTGISLYDVIPGAGDFQRGAPSMGFDVPLESGTARVGVMICYEDIMGSFGRAIHSGGPEMIVNLTNDAWFLDTAEPELHLALSVFRTVEQRTSLIRATNTGISAVIDPTGRIVAQTASHKPAVLLYDVPRMRGAQTPFMVFGNWPSACALVVLVITGLVHRRRKRAGAESVSEA
jgi:apolipoprotein N-acyltransferase